MVNKNNLLLDENRPITNELSGSDSHVELRLLGQPPLQSHLSFIRDRVHEGHALTQFEEAKRWQEANDLYGELEDQEAGVADEISVTAIPESLKPLAERAKRDPRYTFTFDTFPTKFSMVELDKLIIFQTHITASYSERLQSLLSDVDNEENLLAFCLPSESPDAPVTMKKMGSKRYLFSSESTDFRRHSPVVLDASQVQNHDTFGPVSKVIGLAVGYGSNFFTGIQYNDRILLHNGYHRAHALRSAGVTHAPMIIQKVTRQDELEVAAKSDVAEDPKFYFASARPPMFKDFFDPRICKPYIVHDTVKMIEVTFDISEFHVKV